MKISRRSFMEVCTITGFQGIHTQRNHTDNTKSSDSVRTYHICLNPDTFEAYPELLNIVADAGMDQVWLSGFFYGYWPYPHEERRRWHRIIEDKGMASAVINLPLGHPGDSLGAMHDNIPMTPPTHWKMGQHPDGTGFSGTSLHPPATEENTAAIRFLAEEGISAVFLDDDFRLAVSPGMIGGCFCEEHKQRFLQSRGYDESQWEELLDAIQRRNPSTVLREWISFTCDELTDSFRQQQEAAPDIALGNMIMYFGSEKAGIRLQDYRNSLFRVGEFHFSDAIFTPIKGKTNNLFSCLFHRRYARPELAFSETTAYPADQLSARNIAAKLAISTIADVRNTMFMSGMSPYPLEHWSTIAPAMRHNADLHRETAGHRPMGPMKHYWGEYSRLVGNDDPYSLFLALGIPFEVCDSPPESGWTFLSDADAQGVQEGTLQAPNTCFIVRHATTPVMNNMRIVPESLESLYELKHEIIKKMDPSTPYVLEDIPAICAWYPTADAVLLWNLSEKKVSLTLRCADSDRSVTLDGLEISLVPMQ